MGAIDDTIVKTTELSGDYKIQILTATLASNSDTIVLTEAANKISSIVYVDAHITDEMDAECCAIQTSWSTLTITMKTFTEAGVGATITGDETVEILVIGK